MNTINDKKRRTLFAVTSIILMLSGGLLLNQLLLHTTASMYKYFILLTFLSVFLYVVGTAFMGWSVAKKKNKMNGSVVFALLLVAAGLLLLGFNTGYLEKEFDIEYFDFDMKKFFFSWKMICIVLGILAVCCRNFIAGIILIALGSFFCLKEFMIDEYPTTYWPIIIILIGVLILLSAIFRPICSKKCSKHKCGSKHTINENENNDGKINYHIVFDGAEQVIFDSVFKGGNIDVTFGGLELDLRRTSLNEGENFLHINTTFGGVELTVPDCWNIEIRSKGFLGATADSRAKNTEKDYSRKLIIVSKCTFGGIDIK